MSTWLAKCGDHHPIPWGSGPNKRWRKEESAPLFFLPHCGAGISSYSLLSLDWDFHLLFPWFSGLWTWTGTTHWLFWTSTGRQQIVELLSLQYQEPSSPINILFLGRTCLMQPPTKNHVISAQAETTLLSGEPYSLCMQPPAHAAACSTRRCHILSPRGVNESTSLAWPLWPQYYPKPAFNSTWTFAAVSGADTSDCQVTASLLRKLIFDLGIRERVFLIQTNHVILLLFVSDWPKYEHFPNEI